MNQSLAIGGAIAFLVIFNLGYVVHEIVLADFLKAGLGPGVQRSAYNIPVIFLAFVIYVSLLGWAYPIFHSYFSRGRGFSNVKTGLVLGLFCGFLWDSLQGGIIEYATYNVSLSAVLVDSTYHVLEGAAAGAIVGFFYEPLG